MNNKTQISKFNKKSKLAMIIGSTMLVAVLISPMFNNGNLGIGAISQIHKQTTLVSSSKDSSSSTSSSTDSNGNSASFTSNTGDTIAASGIGGGNSSGSSNSGGSSTANSLGNDIRGMVGNLLQKDLGNTIQKSVHSTVAASTDINKMYSGKIASSQINLQTGNVERVLFGDWSLDAKTAKEPKFSAKFSIRSSVEGSKDPAPASTASTKLMTVGSYTLTNLKVNSIQKTNDDTTLRGTVDVSKHGASSTSWVGVPVTTSITNHNTVFTITFDKGSPVSKVFQNTPITGMVTSSS
jgi:hypothetical protein